MGFAAMPETGRRPAVGALPGQSASPGVCAVGIRESENSLSSRPGAMMDRLLILNINGAARPVEAGPSETLAFTLRNKLGLTGAKVACNRGECGAYDHYLNGVMRAAEMLS